VVSVSLGRLNPIAYNYNNEVKEDWMNWKLSMHREKRDGFRVLVGKPEGKALLGRQTHRREENSKMDVMERGTVG
jgi:hypothetical protein